MGGVVTLVPYRPANDRQRWIFDQVLPRLEDLGHPVVVGEPNGDDWSRGQACNNAAASAGDWDVAIVCDADTVPEKVSIDRALYWIATTGGAIRPHMRRTMLNERGSVVFAQRGPAHLDPDLHHERRQHDGGGVIVVAREAWEKVGGFSNDLIGWGYEDSDFNMRMLRHASWDRIPGTAWHLWHGREGNRPRPESKMHYQKLMREYRKDVLRWAADKGTANPLKVL